MCKLVQVIYTPYTLSLAFVVNWRRKAVLLGHKRGTNALVDLLLKLAMHALTHETSIQAIDVFTKYLLQTPHDTLHFTQKKKNNYFETICLEKYLHNKS